MEPEDPDHAEYRLRCLLDPLGTFQPTPTQHRYLNRTCRYAILNGPTRGGKTACNAVDLTQVLTRRHATKSVRSVVGTYLVFATSREAIRDNWYGKLRRQSKLLGPASEQPLIGDWLIEDERFSGGGGDRTIKELWIQGGHRVVFNVSGDVNVWKRLEGKDRVLGVYLDENVGIPELITELYRRLLETHSHPDIKREAGGGFISWSATETKLQQAFSDFMEKCLDPEQEEYELFKIDPSENPAIDQAEREKMRQNMSAADFQVSMQGMGRAVDRLLIYARQWDPSVHMAGNDYEPTKDDNLWAIYDPGGAGQESHNSGIMFAAVTQKDPTTFRIVQYYQHNRTTGHYDMKVIAAYLRGRVLEGFIVDPAVNKTDKWSGLSGRAQLRQAIAAAGIKAYRGLVHPHNGHNDGIKLVQTLLEDHRILVNPSKLSGGPLVRREFESYRSYEEGVYQGERGVVKKNDEAVDCVRYLAMGATNRGASRKLWVPRGCGAMQGPPAPVVVPIKEEVVPTSEQDENYLAQLRRSERMVSRLGRFGRQAI